MALDPYYDQTLFYLPCEATIPGDIVKSGYMLDRSKYRQSIALRSGAYSTTRKYGAYAISIPSGVLNPPYLLNAGSTAWAVGSGDFTIEAWLYANTTQTLGTVNNDIGVINNYASSPNSWRVYLKATVGGARLAFYNGSDLLITGAFPDRIWTHFAVVRYNNSLSIFVNGTLAAGPVTNSVDFNTGLNSPDLFSYLYYQGGSGPFVLDELRITKAALYISDFSANLPGSYIDGFPEPPFTPRNIQIGSSTRVDYKDPYFGSQSITTAGTISGIVKNGSVPVKRRVRLYESSTGNFVREVWAGLDGTFVFKGLDKNKRFTITSHDHLTGYNDVIAARATPV